MFVEGLAEKWRGVNQGLERARTGVDQFLQEERRSGRWTLRHVATGLGKGLVVAAGTIAGGAIGGGAGLFISTGIFGPLAGIVQSEIGQVKPSIESIETGLKMAGFVGTFGLIGLAGMISGIELTGRLVRWLPRRTFTDELMECLAVRD